MTKLSNVSAAANLDLDIWDLFEVWSLKFGVYA